MSAPICTFFNNKGGVGKTTLVYHLAWMLSEMGQRVVVADLDPQSNLTAAFFDDQQLEPIWSAKSPTSIVSALKPLIDGVGGLGEARIHQVTHNLGVIAGDLALSRFEDELAQQWPRCLDDHERAFRVITAFWSVMAEAAQSWKADVVLVDVGPNLGSLNRAVMVASDAVLVPVGSDMFSLQGLRNLGPTLRDWRSQWAQRLDRKPAALSALPAGAMAPIGYVVAQHGVRLDRPVQAYRQWAERIPSEFHRSVLGDSMFPETPSDPAVDPSCLMMLKHYHSLIPLAQEARRPVFLLRSADGALGAHLTSVKNAYDDFSQLATELLRRLDVQLPTT